MQTSTHQPLFDQDYMKKCQWGFVNKTHSKYLISAMKVVQNESRCEQSGRRLGQRQI